MRGCAGAANNGMEKSCAARACRLLKSTQVGPHRTAQRKNMHPDDITSTPPTSAIPRWARRFGYAGLVPFLGLAAACWMVPATLRAVVLQSLVGYGATIASFLGAIHWGLAMRDPLTPQPGPFVWGIFPSLIAWLALMLPPAQGLIALTLLLGLCLAIDLRSYPAYGLRMWIPMRMQLTAIASVSLLVSAWAA